MITEYLLRLFEAFKGFIQALLILSITGLLPCLRGLLKLMGQSSQGADSTILERFHDTASFDVTVFSKVIGNRFGEGCNKDKEELVDLPQDSASRRR